MPLSQNETSEIPLWLCLGDSSFQEICLLNPKNISWDVVLFLLSCSGNKKEHERFQLVYHSVLSDASFCDFKSWPGGKGSGKGSKKDWGKCMDQYGFSEKIALAFNGNPINHMENIARLKVPVLNVVGDADQVVPVAENTALLEKRLNELGWKMKIIHKPGIGHHPHSLKDPTPIVDFILKNTGNL